MTEVEKDGKRYRINEVELEAWLNDGAKEILPEGKNKTPKGTIEVKKNGK